MSGRKMTNFGPSKLLLGVEEEEVLVPPWAGAGAKRKGGGRVGALGGEEVFLGCVRQSDRPSVRPSVPAAVRLSTLSRHRVGQTMKIEVK